MELDTLTKRALAVGALLAGIGVFYHYVIFIPGLEKAKQAQIENDKRETEQRIAEKTRQYAACKADARQAYEADWATACNAVAEDRKLSYANCLKDPLVMYNQFMGEQYCVRTFGKIDPSPDCSLPGRRGESINARFQNALEKCLTESKSGL
jgi:hypothetical protein